MDGFVKHYNEVEEMEMDGGAKIRWLITHKNGAQNFSMRLINIPEGKETPSHSHDYEHEIFVMQGEGSVRLGERELKLREGDFIFIPSNIFHRIRAEKTMNIICVVPIKAAKLILGD
ncbi:MAG: cupin domain-containing protein [Thermoplasmata archaeon]|jgi:quercetin dioxygenase-like cupin family protein|nr:cupin domain-containing protein [Thermoplasmata archaeon]MVT13626.1 cupin domain-containing protein [Euryarchaeota archaeon]MVT14495.1 cupin domain-containing protein [Euryarchaeota archaeon]MVT36316.1 cupin domain-containing protein [Euryarchaeota archaeon]